MHGSERPSASGKWFAGGANPDGERRLGLLWRIAIVFVGAVLVWRGLGWLAETFGPPRQDQFGQADRVGHAVRAVIATAITLPGIWLARRFLDRRPWETLGLATRHVAWRQMLVGMAIWFVAAGIGLVAALTLGGIRISTSGSPSRELVLLAIGLPVLVFLYEALPEELIFRGYFYRNLADRLPRWQAVVSQAVLFTLWAAAIGAAGSGERILVLSTFGLVLGTMRAVAGSIWAGIGYHVAFQWVAQWLVAAMTAGFVQVNDLGMLQFLAFWLFPIVIGSIVLVIWSIRGGRVPWREREPDPPLVLSTGKIEDLNRIQVTISASATPRNS